MDFDRIMDAWKSQEVVPLYGVNRDLLRLVVRHEQGAIRREMRWELWTTAIVGTAITGLAAAVLWWFVAHRQSGLDPLAAGVALAGFASWIGALWVGDRRQALRERGFGNSLQEEVRRNLSLVDYRLSQVGRWTILMLWSAPILVGTSLILWLISEVNDNSAAIFDLSMILFVVVAIAWTNHDASRRKREELLPKRQRLRELLALLEA